MDNRSLQIEKRLNYIEPKQSQPIDHRSIRLEKRNEQRFIKSKSSNQNFKRNNHTSEKNRNSLTIKKSDLVQIKKKNKKSIPHFHVAKNGTISKKTSQKSVLLNNRVAKHRQGIVLDRLKNKLIDEHLDDDTDIGFQATHSTNKNRKKIVRSTKSVKNFVQSSNRAKYLSSGTKNTTKLQMQSMVVGALESENPVTDTGFTATSRTATNAKTTNELLKKGKNLVRGKKAIRTTNAVRERNRIARMKGISRSAAQSLQKGATSVIEAGRYFIAKLQESMASKGILLLALFFGVLIIVGTAIGGSGGALEMEEQEELSFSTTGLSEDVLQWKDTVEQELEKYNLTEYTDLILVIIHLESRGKLPDVMQSSESIGLAPNTIDNPEESIKVGVQYFKSIYDDMSIYGVDIQTLIQAYNFGRGFIPYVAKNGKVWKQKLSDDFSDMQARKLGWNSYGDKNYVPKAMQYLTVDDDEIKLTDTDFDLKGGKLVFPVPNYTAVSSSYGWRTHPISGERKFHTGTDIPAPTGTPVIASADGVVIEAGWKGGYGNAVVIDHGSSVKTLYGHNSSLDVHAGQTVKAGDIIARVGSTGKSTGPHSHFEVMKDGKYTDPMKWFN